jgi:hypothetical protein
MHDTIHEYIRERGRISGVMLGTVIDGEIRIGWSKTNFSAGDKFDKDEGLRIALSRAKGEYPDEKEMPHVVISKMREFQIRCLRYFRQGLFPIAPVKTAKSVAKDTERCACYDRFHGDNRKNRVMSGLLFTEKLDGQSLTDFEDIFNELFGVGGRFFN